MAMKSSHVLLACAVLLAAFVGAQAGVNSTLLPKSIIVHATINGQNISATNSLLRYEQDNLTVVWSLNSSFVGQDTNYKEAQIKLCYGAPSAVDRPWRTNSDDLSVSKTCKVLVANQPYTPAGGKITWQANNGIAGALYFVRVFILNATGPTALPATNAVAVGSTSNLTRTSNLFTLVAYTGRHGSITGAIIAFSVFSYLALAGFFLVEKFAKKRK